MRPSIVSYLNNLFDIPIFHYVIPTPSQIYFIAFFFVAYTFIKRTQNWNYSLRSRIIFILLCGISASIGSKLFYVLTKIESYLIKPHHVFASGSISWGAYSAIVLFVIIYANYKKESTLQFLDVLCTCIPLGIFIGRWSCFLNGDDYGIISKVPWAVQYPFDSMPYGEHYDLGLIDITTPLSLAVHPNQLYLSLNGLILFFIITRIWRKNKDNPGLTFIIYLIVYGFTRFLFEFFRYYPDSKIFLALNPSQWLALLCGVSGLLLLIMFRYKINASRSKYRFFNLSLFK